MHVEGGAVIEEGVEEWVGAARNKRIRCDPRDLRGGPTSGEKNCLEERGENLMKRRRGMRNED